MYSSNCVSTSKARLAYAKLCEIYEKMYETSMSCRRTHNAIQDAPDLCSISLSFPSSFLSRRPPGPMVPFRSPKMSVQNHPKRNAWDAGKPMRFFFTYAPPEVFEKNLCATQWIFFPMRRCGHTVPGLQFSLATVRRARCGRKREVLTEQL